MENEKFYEIIDFAIGREEIAVFFYLDLQKKAKFAALSEILGEFAEMERGHMMILMKIRENGLSKVKPKEVEDLHISDYIVSAEPSDDMSYQDILTIAIKREEAAAILYSNMAEMINDAELKNLFKKLAAEEAGHKLKFEKIYDDEILKEN
ncbi:MAG: ferritin family protein [Candidatus Cloacimonetes bacterium]|nr:ferritin family protein [Candidatus Cloacimonadota bacterium]